MPLTTTQIILTALLKFGPELAEGIYKLIQVENPTPAQWAEVFAIARKSYSELVPNSKLDKE